MHSQCFKASIGFCLQNILSLFPDRTHVPHRQLCDPDVPCALTHCPSHTTHEFELDFFVAMKGRKSEDCMREKASLSFKVETPTM